MFLVELVIQGVRGIRELARLRFQNGFNIVIAGNEAGKTTTVDTLQRLLFPSAQAGNSETLISRYSPDASRSALVVCSDDGSYYRVIQDFMKSAVNLSKYNPATKEFNLLHKDWDNTTKFVRGLMADLSEKDYAKVFVLRREHFHDSSFPGAPASSAKNRTSLHEPVHESAPRDSVARTRLAELRETLRKAEEAADADYRYQSAKLAREDMNKKLASLDEIEKKNAEIETSLAELKACENLPGNLNEVL
jgi:predicted ATP-dependent endonuclease of OLD family